MDFTAKISQVQRSLDMHNLDGWLLADFKGRNEIVRNFLEIPSSTMLTRKLFVWIPRKGAPVAIVSGIEAGVISHLPIKQKNYSGLHTLQSLLEKEIKEASTIAMEYSWHGTLPVVSYVDAGTVDLIRSFGKEVVSSARFLQEVTCVLNEKQLQSHKEATKVIDKALSSSWSLLRESFAKGKTVTEFDIVENILDIFESEGCHGEGAPICAFGKNGADPHYEVTRSKASVAKKGDTVLIDLWCKKNEESSVYADVTQMGVLSDKATKRQEEVFAAVQSAQTAAIDLLMDRYSNETLVKGFELDEVARREIKEKGFDSYFTHRLGHNIYTTDHGPGANLDSFESVDDRPLIRGTCFSIEPGVYIPEEIGVRLECDIYVPKEGMPVVTTKRQENYIFLL